MGEVDQLVERTYQRFADSQFGQYQAGQTLRYAKGYGYGSREQMLQDLGEDIHPLRHMLYTHDQLVVPLLNGYLAQELSPAETEVLRTAALIHDIGECEHPVLEEATGQVVGDVLYLEKNSHHEAAEAVIRKWLYQTLYSEFEDGFIDRIEDVVVHSESDELSNVFNLVERLGYYETAINAGSLALEAIDDSTEDTERVRQLGRLGYVVATTHRPVLEKRSTEFEYIERRLEDTNGTFNRVEQELAVTAAA